MRNLTKLSRAILAVTLLASINCTGENRRPDAEASRPASDESSARTPSTSEAPTLERTDFMRNLRGPWDLAFLPSGHMFFTEKCEGLSVRMPDGRVNRLFGKTGYPVAANDLVCLGQSGMQGVAIDPEFAQNRFVYVYMTSNLSGRPRTNRVIRLVVNEAFTSVSDRRDLITTIPFKDRDNAVGGAGAHSGGRLRFGPDGFLYVTTGDNHNSSLPQGLTNLGAKVLRVTRDGSPAPGNNSPASGDPLIYTFGHRNPQGISFRPGTGQAYIAEHGPGHTDEVTALNAGGNGGWDPRPEEGVTCPDNYCGYGSNKTDGTPTPMTDVGKFPNAMRPVWTNSGRSQGMGPCEFLKGSQWKAWENSLAVGIMGDQRLEILMVNAEGGVSGTATAQLPRSRMRSTVLGPDGNLYIATDSGSIWKIVPR